MPDVPPDPAAPAASSAVDAPVETPTETPVETSVETRPEGSEATDPAADPGADQAAGLLDAEQAAYEPDEAALAAVQAHDDRFLDRELSWLHFNQRVLELAEDPALPLLERVRFLAIFTSNLDEFFMVRVAGLKRRIATGLAVRAASGLMPLDVLERIWTTTRELSERQASLFRDRIVPELLEHVIAMSGLIDHYRKEKGERGLDRIDNLEELVTAARDFEPAEEDEDVPLLAAFLTHGKDYVLRRHFSPAVMELDSITEFEGPCFESVLSCPFRRQHRLGIGELVKLDQAFVHRQEEG